MRKIKWPKIGEYALVTQWSDKDPHDPWNIGFITDVIESSNGIYYIVSGSCRKYKHVYRISKEEGAEWLKTKITVKQQAKKKVLQRGLMASDLRLYV